jgi:dipeptidyl aminopeptidase/acylaminoacyl peptidase
MAQVETAPYGSWLSPLTSDLLVAGIIRLDQICLDNRNVYWLEGRPTERGRNVIVRRTLDGTVTDMTPPTHNVRTRVHEYGGGSYIVADDIIYFSNYADQRLYRQQPGQEPEPITPAAELRYADFVIDHRRGRLICIREDHTVAGREAVNTIVTLALGGDEEGGQILVAGNDFYASPRLSPDGSQLAWLTWNHPNMPWDGCELWLGRVLSDGSVGYPRLIAGGPTESIFQPEWSPDGTLHFISDRNGWWNLHAWRDGRVERLIGREAEFGQPQWVFRQSTYAFLSPGRILCTFSERGISRLATIDTITLRLEPIGLPYSDIHNLQAALGQAVCIAGSATEPFAIAEMSALTFEPAILKRSTELTIDEGYLSVPQAIEFPTEGGLTAHAFYYPPQNKDFRAPAGEQPPLLVNSHGGPTGSTSSTLNLGIQYWTSRGFAVVDVNYGGSTGYGRAYRERLNGQWGIVDVDDCINAARYLTEQGLADPNRVAIRGGSAGGYTTLCALTFRDFFTAGASHFGVSDPAALARDTHKFESRYLDHLIGPYPEKQELYEERSPIHHARRLACPVIFFQGLEDAVVPPSQAETMFAAVRANEQPTAYLAFEGEQHGFRQAQNIKRTLDAELYFYAKIFNFDLAEPVEPVDIENL